jgi:hypothetical protein
MLCGFFCRRTQCWRIIPDDLAAVIGLVLFTIGTLEHPFSGGARIGTGAFELVLERFETSKLSNLR